MKARVLLDHGEGGAAAARLVRQVFLSRFGTGPVLEDAAVLELGARAGTRLAFTTDSFVVRPLFFPGGDIGRLAVCGTVNDLAMMGALPRYLSVGFILEEGLEIAVLEAVADSMARTAGQAGVQLVTGDTKVVGRGEADGLYINTSGLGILEGGSALSAAHCRPGDQVLVSAPVGDHGTAVMVAREGFDLGGQLRSDCRPLGARVQRLLAAAPGTRCLRDPTRGGLASALLELCQASRVGMSLEEEAIPVRPAVASACELLGLDPLYVACEGCFVAVVPHDQGPAALRELRARGGGQDAAIIGQVVADPQALVLRTAVGGRRPLLPLEGAQLPRIC